MNTKTLNNYDVPGLSGLRNIGNTCYFNSALQALSNTKYFNAYIRNKNFLKQLQQKFLKQLQQKSFDDNKNYTINDIDIYYKQDFENYCNNSLTYQLYKLFDVMWSNNHCVTPIKLKILIGKLNKHFIGFNQHDSQELLNMLLDQIHEETKIEIKVLMKNIPQDIINFLEYKNDVYNKVNDNNLSYQDKKKLLDNYSDYLIKNNNTVTIYKAYNFWRLYIKNNFSIISQLFTGLFHSNITCSVCGFRSDSFEPFTNLQLSIHSTTNNITSIYDCFQEFSKPEYLFNNNKYNCSICKKKVNAVKQINIWKAPDVLIIHLKKYKNDIINFKNNIISRNSKIHSRINYPINNLDINSIMSKININNNNTEHKYNLFAVTNHYGNLNGGHYLSYCKNFINNSWYKFNDSNISFVSDISSEIINNNAYILYYEKL